MGPSKPRGHWHEPRFTWCWHWPCSLDPALDWQVGILLLSFFVLLLLKFFVSVKHWLHMAITSLLVYLFTTQHKTHSWSPDVFFCNAQVSFSPFVSITHIYCKDFYFPGNYIDCQVQPLNYRFSKTCIKKREENSVCFSDTIWRK